MLTNLLYEEVEDNSQLKDDTKDPKFIANLVNDGNFGMPYIPEKLYAELRRLSMFRDQLNEDRVQTINRMHREMKIYFPEYKDALGKVNGAFSLELLKQAPFLDDLISLGEDGIRQIWHDAKLRGRGYSRAGEILWYAKTSVGIKDGAAAGKTAVKWFVQRILELDAELAVIENQINQKCQEIPHTGNILEISGIGENTLSGILAEMWDISRFDDVKEIQKLSELGLVACSSGKHKGGNQNQSQGTQTTQVLVISGSKISSGTCGGIQRNPCLLHDKNSESAKKDAVTNCNSLQASEDNLHDSEEWTVYDPKKMLLDIRRPEKKEETVA